MTDSVCVCSAHKSVVMLVDAMFQVLTCKYLIKKIVCDIERNKSLIHQCKSCPCTATLKKLFDQELNIHEGDEKFNYCQSDTTDQAILATFTVTYQEYKETLIDVIDDLTRHFYIAKLKITSS